MNKKEIEQKLKDVPEDKNFYQRYEGRITKYKYDGRYYINCETGLASRKDEMFLFGKISESIIDLVEIRRLCKRV